MRVLIIAASVLALTSSPAFAAGIPDPSTGKMVAQMKCADCHAITLKEGKEIPPRVQGKAPAFATIAHDPEVTADKLRETLRLPHGAMSNVLLTEKDVDNVISYILAQRANPAL